MQIFHVLTAFAGRCESHNGIYWNSCIHRVTSMRARTTSFLSVNNRAGRPMILSRQCDNASNPRLRHNQPPHKATRFPSSLLSCNLCFCFATLRITTHTPFVLPSGGFITFIPFTDPSSTLGIATPSTNSTLCFDRLSSGRRGRFPWPSRFTFEVDALLFVSQLLHLFPTASDH